MIRDLRARRVLVLVDDMTRPTPQRLMLPAVLDHLVRHGVPTSGITVLIATGLHRPMSPSEIAHRFGDPLPRGITIVNHDAYDDSALVTLATSGDGTAVKVNRLVRESDLVLSLGCIEPHRVAGFSGGAKMVQPGISGAAITASIHWRGWLKEGRELYGIADNPHPPRNGGDCRRRRASIHRERGTRPRRDGQGLLLR